MVHRIWYPLQEKPITVQMSREQLEGVRDSLAGRPEGFPGWNAYFAGVLDSVLNTSVDETNQ